jgi:hypothetical protein
MLTGGAFMSSRYGGDPIVGVGPRDGVAYPGASAQAAHARPVPALALLPVPGGAASALTLQS